MYNIYKRDGYTLFIMGQFLHRLYTDRKAESGIHLKLRFWKITVFYGVVCSKLANQPATNVDSQELLLCE